MTNKPDPFHILGPNSTKKMIVGGIDQASFDHPFGYGCDDKFQQQQQAGQDISLNVTGDSIEGYVLFTDSSFECGQDLVKTLTEKDHARIESRMNNVHTSQSPTNSTKRKATSNDFIQKKRKGLGSKARDGSEETNSLQTSSNKPSNKKYKERTSVPYKEDEPIWGATGDQYSNERLTGRSPEQSRPSLPTYIRASEKKGGAVQPLVSRHLNNPSSDARDTASPYRIPQATYPFKKKLDVDYASMCKVVRENLNAMPRRLSSNNSENSKASLGNSNDKSSKHPIQQHHHRSNLAPPAQNVPATIKSLLASFSKVTKPVDYDVGVRTEIDRIKHNIDSMIQKASGSSTLKPINTGSFRTPLLQKPSPREMGLSNSYRKCSDTGGRQALSMSAPSSKERKTRIGSSSHRNDNEPISGKQFNDWSQLKGNTASEYYHLKSLNSRREAGSGKDSLQKCASMTKISSFSKTVQKILATSQISGGKRAAGKSKQADTERSTSRGSAIRAKLVSSMLNTFMKRRDTGKECSDCGGFKPSVRVPTVKLPKTSEIVAGAQSSRGPRDHSKSSKKSTSEFLASRTSLKNLSDKYLGDRLFGKTTTRTEKSSE